MNWYHICSGTLCGKIKILYMMMYWYLIIITHKKVSSHLLNNLIKCFDTLSVIYLTFIWSIAFVVSSGSVEFNHENSHNS